MPTRRGLQAELRPERGIERAVSFGAGLRGVLSLPDAGARDGRVAVLCNTGGDPRVGAGRFSTLAARRLAAHGVAALRFDFAGLGDSPLPSGPERSHVYETPREADLDAAIGFLAGEGLDRPVVVGLCAGAYHAFWGAVRDPRIEGVFLISFIKIVWRPGDSLDIGRRDEARATRSYLQGLRDPEVWRRIARGEVRLGPIASSLLRRFASRLGASAGRLERRRVRQAAAAIAARGGRAHMLLGLDDGALDELQTYFGHDGRDWAARPNFTVSIVDGLDHGLLRAASRAVALEELCRFMAG